MSVNRPHAGSEPGGMASESQIAAINKHVTSPAFSLPLASFLKNITGGKAGSIEELTSAQADDVLGVAKKLVKTKK